MKNAVSSSFESWRPDLRDCVAGIGLGLLGYGLWLVFPPAAYIADGAVLVGLAVFGGRR